jgi:hypothetical protein
MSFSTSPNTTDEKYLNILLEARTGKGFVPKVQVDKARIQFIKDYETWRFETVKPYCDMLNALPNSDIDAFWEKYNSDASQVAKWSKEEPFNAFMMGYLLAVREILFGQDCSSLSEKGTEKP